MLTTDDLKRLATVSGSCLTILQPLQSDRPGTGHTAVRAAIQRAAEFLPEKTFDADDRVDMLRPLFKVAANTNWTGRNGSVAMFRAPDFTMVTFCPDVVPSRIHFAQEFLVLPLLPGILSERGFWLLALSLEGVRLFRGSERGLIETALPPSLTDGLLKFEAFDQPDHSLRGRSTAGRSIGSMKGVQFGTANAREAVPAHLHDFFKALDRGIHPMLSECPLPLILAGVTRELAIYRAINTYSGILAGAVRGSPGALGSQVLHAKATQLMSARAAMMTNAVLRDMEEAASHLLLCTDCADILDASTAGRVEELILSPGDPQFGLHEEAINCSVVATIRNSGKIRVIDVPRMMKGGAAAILRFRRKEYRVAMPVMNVAMRECN